MRCWQVPVRAHRTAEEGVTRAPAIRTTAAAPPVAGLATGAAVASLLTVLWLEGARTRYRRRVTHPASIDLLVMPQDPTLADGQPVVLWALGDSGMAGVGVTNVHEALPVQIAVRVAAAIGRPVHLVSSAQPGARTRDVATHQLSADVRPDVVVLLVGTNDVTHMTPVRQLVAETTDLLERLDQTGAPVMGGLPAFGAMRAVPRILRTALGLRAIAVEQAQRQACLDGGTGSDFVNVRALVGREFVRNAALMSPDGFHPSAAGYCRIADAMAPAVAAAVTEVRRSAPSGAPRPTRPRRTW